MTARLIIAAIAFVVLGATSVTMLRRPSRDAVSDLAPPVRTGAFDTLTIKRGGAATTLRRRGDAFWVTAPVSYAADPTAAAAAFEAIETLDPGALVTRRSARYAALEVDEGKGIAVQVSEEKRPRLDLVIGKTIGAGAGAGTGTGTMVRVRARQDPDPVWQMNGDLRTIFDKRPSDWRDRSITTFTAEEAREIAIQAQDGARILVRKNEASDAGAPGWTVIQSTQPIDALDDQVATEIIATMAALKAGDFADGATASTAGLDPPALTITVTLRDGEKNVLLIGRRSGAEDVFVKSNESAQIFLARRFDIDRVNRRPIQFRRKVLCDLRDDEIQEITVRHGVDSYTLIRDGQDGRTWRATAPRGLRVDPDKVAAFPSIFRGWRAPRIAEDPPRGAVDSPSVVITGRSKKGRCAIFAVPGSRGGDSYYLAKAPPSTEVFELPRWMIDRVAVKLDQIRAR